MTSVPEKRPAGRTRTFVLATALVALVAAGGVGTGLIPTPEAQAQITLENGAPQQGFADLVDAVSPAVVSIRIRAEAPSRDVFRGFPDGPDFRFDFPDLPEDHPFRRFFEEFNEQFGQRRGPGGPGGQGMPRRQFEAMGSGFIISPDGYVVTNNHVIEAADEVVVVTEDGAELPAEVVGTDSRTDLALLKIDTGEDLPYVEFADDEVRVGDWVVAVGNPFGLGGTVTAGIVSARGRDISANIYDDFIQIDAAVNRGNSGGPAFNLSGRVIGVNTAIFSPTGGNVGIAFAIPAAVASQVVADLMDDGVVTRGFLGVSLQDINDQLAAGLGLSDTAGALVTEPIAGAPAADAGVRSGDVIIAVNGTNIDSSRTLARTIGAMAPGETANLTIIRGGEETEIPVLLTTLNDDVAAVESPTPDEAVPDEPQAADTSLGITLLPNEGGEGLVVDAIEADSPAAVAGLGIGDVILEADSMVLDNPEDFARAISNVTGSNRDTLLVKATRDGQIRFVGIPLESEDA